MLTHAALCVCACQVVVDQGVLTRAASDLTVSGASSIADNTLEYSMRCVMWALHSHELMHVADGQSVRLSGGIRGGRGEGS